jgi:hypothetical protein
MNQQHKSVLQPNDLTKLFKVSTRHAPAIAPGLALQFIGRVRESELFRPLAWSCWNGQFVRLPGSRRGADRVVDGGLGLKAWYDALTPGAPDAPIMTMSREEYRKLLREVRELAGFTAWGKDCFRIAGIALFTWNDQEYMAHRHQMLGHVTDSATTASFFHGNAQDSWATVASAITPEALQFKP